MTLVLMTLAEAKSSGLEVLPVSSIRYVGKRDGNVYVMRVFACVCFDVCVRGWMDVVLHRCVLERCLWILD